MFETSWITAILQLYSQVTDLFGNIIVKRITIRLFDLLALFHYILKLPRMPQSKILKDTVSKKKYVKLLTYFPLFHGMTSFSAPFSNFNVRCRAMSNVRRCAMNFAHSKTRIQDKNASR